MIEMKQVLLVEDNPDDIDLILRVFEREISNANVTVVKDGAEALDYLFYRGRHANRDGGSPHLVVLDLILPRLNGFQVLERLRGEPLTRRLPVIVLTSSEEDRDVSQTYDLGANSYVRKPVKFDEFSRAVHDIGNYWLSRNVNPSSNTAG